MKSAIHTSILSMIIGLTVLRADDFQYLILSTESFEPAAQVIETLYTGEVVFVDRLEVEFITTEAIAVMYSELSLSQAIREYLLHEILVNPSLQYLLLLGDETLLPPLYNGSNNPSDDFYTCALPLQALPQISTGRIPVSNLEDALSVVNKIRNHILFSDTGAWREKVILLADDANKAGGGSFAAEITHVMNSDMIYDYIGDELNVSCLYGTDYVPNFSGGGWPTLPGLTNDFITEINTGAAWINYIGHGNETTLADEIIVDMARDMDRISPPDGKESIWVIGSCGFGHYDNAECMSEELLKTEHGAVALITPTRDLSIDAVAIYIQALYANIDDYLNGLNDYRIGDILRVSKTGGSQLHYHLFGDPAMRLPFPKTNSVVQSAPGALRILEPAQLTTHSAFAENDAYLVLRGAPHDVTQVYGNGHVLTYTLPGQMILGGGFQSMMNIIPPLDMPYCDDCPATIKVYIDSNDQTGWTETISDLQVLEPLAESSDFTGPEVEYFLYQLPLEENDVIAPPYELRVEVNDNSGINVMGALGHEIRYWLDDEQPVTMTHQFVYDFGDVTSGSFPVSIIETKTGLHNLYVEVWDNANNRTESSITLCFSNCAPPLQGQENDWSRITSLLNATELESLDDTTIIASTSGGLLEFNTETQTFRKISSAQDLEVPDILSMAKDAYGNLWLGSQTPSGSMQIYHPEFGLQSNIDHLEIDAVHDITINTDVVFAVYQSGLQYGILDFRFDASNLPYFQNHYSHFPQQVTMIYDIDIYGNSIFLTTDSGLFSANFTEDVLSSASSWTEIAPQVDAVQFIPGIVPVLVTSSSIWILNQSDNWQQVYGSLSGDILDADFDQNEGIYSVLTNYNYYEFSTSLQLLPEYPFHVPDVSDFRCYTRADGFTAIGLENKGFLILDQVDLTHQFHVPNTLAANNYTAITVSPTGWLGGAGKDAGVFFLDGNQVTNYLSTTIAASYFLDDENPDNFTAVSLAYAIGSNAPWSIHFSNIGHLIFSNSGMPPSEPGFRGGVVEIDPVTYQYSVYDTTGGILDGLNGMYNQSWNNRYITTNQMTKDASGNLWVANPYSETYNHIAAIQMADGQTWTHVTGPDLSSHLPNEIAFDLQGRAWFALEEALPINDNIDEYADGGLRVVNTAGTLFNEDDDVWIDIINQEILPDPSVWSIDIDQNNVIWVLTSNGVQGYTDQMTEMGIQLQPVSDEVYLTHLPLYKGDHIRVDSDNTKWITTRHSGVFAIREDLSFWPDENGLKTENCGILSDNVFDVAFDEENDIIYFATDKGISGLTISAQSDFEGVYGDINSNGLTDMADVLTLIQILLGNLDQVNFNTASSDVNNDNVLDIFDLAKILVKVLDIEAADEHKIERAEVRIHDGRLTISADQHISVIQLEFNDSPLMNRMDLLPDDWEMWQKDGLFIACSLVKTSVSEITLLELDDDISIDSAIVCDWNGDCISAMEIPENYHLGNPYPNPFNPSVSLSYDIVKSGLVRISIIDLLGREVEVLVDEEILPGTHLVSWNAQNKASGVYFCRLEADNILLTRKLMLIK